jgi:RNA polymerase sigma-70 factor (ECF subfamily)
MLNIAFRLIGDYEEACEAVQDAFVAAYKNLNSFRGDAKFSTWLTTITLNHARNRLKQVRSRRLHIAASLDEPVATEDGELRLDPACREPSALDVLEARDTRLKVRGCIDALEPEYREVIILRDLQDLSYEEIAAAVKVREGTVKSRLFRAREAVKECLKRALGIL